MGTGRQSENYRIIGAPAIYMSPFLTNSQLVRSAGKGLSCRALVTVYLCIYGVFRYSALVSAYTSIQSVHIEGCAGSWGSLFVRVGDHECRSHFRNSHRNP